MIKNLANLICFSFVLLFCSIGFSQNKTKLEIRKANKLKSITTETQSFKKLIGDVVVFHKGVIIQCDSALLYENENKIDAIGNVKINQGDSIFVSGKEAYYFGNKDYAVINGNVILIHNKATLETPSLELFLLENVGIYRNGGKLIDSSVTLRSQYGNYNSNTSMALFRHKVILNNDDYVLTSDSLLYNTTTETTTFLAPTHIRGSDNKIYCEGGWYHAPSAKSMFKHNAYLKNPGQEIKADSISYSENEGLGFIYSNASLYDSSENVKIYAHYANYVKEDNRIIATETPILVKYFDNDSLMITADTLYSYLDTIKDQRNLKAWNHVSLFKSDLQGVCDSIYYSDKDSLMSMFGDPVLWTDSTQFSSDTILLRIVEGKPQQINLNRNALIVTKHDSLALDQIKGKNIIGYFVRDTLTSMKVEKNGESIYYVFDSDSAYIGINKITCGLMWIYMKNNKVDYISFEQEPIGGFYSYQLINPRDYILEGTKWHGDQRPLSFEEILAKRFLKVVKKEK